MSVILYHERNAVWRKYKSIDDDVLQVVKVSHMNAHVQLYVLHKDLNTTADFIQIVRV